MYIDQLGGMTISAQLWLPCDEIEEAAQVQIRNTASLPWVTRMAIMPDCHFGKGATVGSVIALDGAVSPACVGVDIGCGMNGLQTSLTASHLPSNLGQLRNKIEKFIPVGFESRQQVSKYAEKSRLWKSFQDLDPKVHDQLGKARKQVGTLGGGELVASVHRNVQ